MARRKQNESNKNTQQLNIFDSMIIDNNHNVIEENVENDAREEDFDEEIPESKRDADEETIQKEFIFIELFKTAIIKQNSNDAVMIDFADYVLPNFLKVAIGVTAKGGKWIEEKLAAGNLKSDRALHDQSLSTHILNGLFAANFIEQQLEKLNTSIRRYIKELDRRIGIAGFILHDFEKFDYKRFPKMPQKYLKTDKDYKLSIEEKREIIDVIIRHLQLNYFINADDPEAYQEYLDDFLAIADNTQTRWGTNWNFSIANGLSPKLYKVNSQKLLSLTGLSCLADRLSSIVKHPQDALNPSINNILHILSDGQLKLTYHSIAENRGVLTNIVNNALIDEFLNINTSEHQYYQPLLYLPTGVIYLASRDAPPVSVENIPERVINKIKSLCAEELRKRQTGFNRDGKGMKYADYYHLFFQTPEMMYVGLEATLRILKDGKKPVSQERSNSLIKFQKQGVLSSDYNFEFKDDIRIDQIAEFSDLITRKIWDEKINQIKNACKQDQKLPKPPELDLIAKIVIFWNLSDYLYQIRYQYPLYTGKLYPVFKASGSGHQ